LTVEPAALPLFGFSGSVLNGNNAITYGQGVSPAYGQITVDAGEPLMFANKDALTISTGNGTDTVSLNDPGIPSGSTIGSTMASVAVNGGDPSTGDLLVVNAVPTTAPAAPDALDVTPTGTGAGAVAHSADLNPPVTFAGMGHLRLVGQPAGGSTFGVDGTIGDDRFGLMPGATPDAGSVTGYLDQNNATGVGPFPLVPIAFSGMSPLVTAPGQSAPGILFDAINQIGGKDTLVFYGSSTSDRFAAGGATNTFTLQDTSAGQVFSNVVGQNLTSAIIEGQGGTSAATVSGITVPLSLDGVPNLTVHGTGSGGVSVDLGAGTAQESGFAPATFTGVSTLNVDAAGQALTVVGTGTTDELSYTPTGPQAGAVRVAGVPATKFTNVAGAFTINPSGSGGSVNPLTIVGTSAGDTITAIGGTTPTVQVNALKAAGLVVSTGATLSIEGAGGDDVVFVNSGAAAFPMPISFDGGDGNNQVALFGGSATADTATLGFDPGAGQSSLTIGGVRQTVSYSRVERALDLVAGPLIVSGPVGSGAMTYSAGAVPANGLVTLDGHGSIEFSKKSTLDLAAGPGSQTVSLDNAATPTGLTQTLVSGVGGSVTLTANAHGNVVDVATAGRLNVTSQPPVQYAGVAQVHVVQAAGQALTPVPAVIRTGVGTPLTNVVVGGFVTPAPVVTDPATFAASIDWGDGSAPTAGQILGLGGGAFQVFGSHTYATVGSPVIKVTVTRLDSTGSQVVGGVPVTVMETGGTQTIVATQAVIANPGKLTGPLTGRLNPASDSGESNSDAITNVTRPNFLGTAGAGLVVKLFATPSAGGATTQVGQGLADANGNWSITTSPMADGSYTIGATASDPSTAAITATATILSGAKPLVIDTVGPVVTSVVFHRLRGQIDAVFRDNRSGIDHATASSPDNYRLVKLGPQGPVTIHLTSVNVAHQRTPTAPYPVTLTFLGGNELRGGSYGFAILAGPGTLGIRDVAGNRLDGIFTGTFPSGNGVPGSNFVALLRAFHGKNFPPAPFVSAPSRVAHTAARKLSLSRAHHHAVSAHARRVAPRDAAMTSVARHGASPAPRRHGKRSVPAK
jgi:hypothetical protein